MNLRAVLVRARQLLHRSQLAREQDEEFAFHRQMEMEYRMRQGMPADEARRAAAIAFGGAQRFREEARDARGFAGIERLGRELSLAFRRTSRSLTFTASVVVTLGIGVGTVVGIGMIVYGVLLRPLPYINSRALVRVSLLTPGLPGTNELQSGASYTHFAKNSQSFAQLGAYFTNDGITLTEGDAAERITGALITPNILSMLGVTPRAGRLFTVADTSWSRSDAVLISEDLWERRYGRDANIVGRNITLNTGARRVVGILPRSFDFPSPKVSVWYPMPIDLASPSLGDRYYGVIGRLRGGVSAASAQGELDALLPRIADRFPSLTPATVARSRAQVKVQSLKSWMIMPVRPQLLLLAAMVSAVLLIAITNVLSLFLLRAERARREIAIAKSLGATTTDLARRFVVEGAVFGIASTLVALPIAVIALITKLGFVESDIPRLHEIALGPSAGLLTVFLAFTVGALIGLLAFLRIGIANVADELRGGRATGSRRWQRVQRVLVASQIAFAFALLASAALIGRSFWNLRNAKLGFATTEVTTFQVSLPYNGYSSNAEASAFHARVMDKLNAAPGVRASATSMQLPLAPSGAPQASLRLERADGESARGTTVPAQVNLVTPGYFALLGTPLLRGRTFQRGDLASSPPGVMLSESVARTLFAGSEPIGREIRSGNEPGGRTMRFRVIGVVGDVIGERIESGPSAMLYFPVLRDGDGLGQDSFPIPYVPRYMHYLVKAPTPLSAQLIRSVVSGIDKRVPAVRIEPLSAIVEAATARVRLLLLLLAVAGTAALTLGMAGVFSIVSYAVVGRAREFGVRLTLGATSRSILTMVLRDAIVLSVMGIVGGASMTIIATPLLRSMLYEVSPGSISEWILVSVLLSAATLVATFLPARRAANTDPAMVLRGE